MLFVNNLTLRRMKENLRVRFVLFLAALLLHPFASPAITFTGDAQIGVYDTNFDGLDIVVTNCTLTVDGPHAFKSLQILNGGVLTHTYAVGGVLPAVIFTVTSEPHTLSSTVLAALNSPNVILSTIVVRDL